MALGALLFPSSLAAQGGASRARVSLAVNGVYQATANPFRDAKSFRENAEDGRFDTDYTVEGGPAFDVSGAVALWRRLAIGVGVSRFRRTTPVSFSASVPHPFFFNRPRTIEADVGGLAREEVAMHLQARGVFDVSTRVQVTLFGGPTWFRVRQPVVVDFEYAEVYPYDAITFQRAETVSETTPKAAFNVGGDVAYFFARRIGVGGSVRLASASVDLPSAGGGTRRVTVGGVQAGAGMRVRF